jgi:hypothetical protein
MRPELVNEWSHGAILLTYLFGFIAILFVSLVFIRKTSFAVWLAISAGLLTCLAVLDVFHSYVHAHIAAMPAAQADWLSLIHWFSASLRWIMYFGLGLIHVAVVVGFLELRRNQQRLENLIAADAPVPIAQSTDSTRYVR